MSSEKEENDMDNKKKMNLELSEKEYEVYQFLIKYIKENGYAPSIRKIKLSLGIGGSSTVLGYLDGLERKKKIKRGEGARAICLTEYTFVHRSLIK